ncbi:MAG: hypothetical protein NC324_02295 [Bacteroides sp.]|nr:hypothetical protein [Bacteroides sp.]
MIDFNPANIQAMAAGARYGYEVPEAAAPSTGTATTGTATGSGPKLSGTDLAAIINGAIGGATSILDSLKGLWTKDSTSTSVTLQDQNLASLGSGNNKSNTWVWVVGGMAVVALVVFLVLRKKK